MGNIGRRPNYLLQVGTIWHFRFKIPIKSSQKDCNNLSGEIRLSLKTGNLKKARTLASLLAIETKRLINGGMEGMAVTKEDIRSVLGVFLRQTLDKHEDDRLDEKSIAEPQTANEKLTYIAKDIQSQLQGKGGYGQINIKDFCEQTGLPEITINDPLHKFIRRELLILHQSIIKIEQERIKGNFNSSREREILMAYPIETSQVISIKPKKSSPLIKDLIEDWKKEHIQANLWKPRTLKAYNGHFRVMLQILGKKSHIGTIDHPTVKVLKDTLLTLPAGMNKKKTFENKTVSEIIEDNKSVKAPTMSVSTVNRYLISLGAFFKWCVGNGYMDTNYAEGKKIKAKKVSPDQQRDVFSTDDLNSLFGAPGYTEDKFKEPYQFWLPILGLFTGARLNELCQLRLDDIQTIDGIYTFTFQEDAQDETISVKSDSGLRTIPIHPFVADELNLRDYVESLRSKGEIRLFPELPYQNDNYGHKATKWFGLFRKSCGIDSPKKVYHSFRHTLTDNLKQQLIKDSLIDELTGHVLQGETMGRYGKRYRVDVLYNEAVLKLEYNVDLSHLKKSHFAKIRPFMKKIEPITTDSEGRKIYHLAADEANSDPIRAARLRKKAKAGDKEAQAQLEKMMKTPMYRAFRGV